MPKFELLRIKIKLPKTSQVLMGTLGGPAHTFYFFSAGSDLNPKAVSVAVPRLKQKVEALTRDNSRPK